jgi:hypothetical protein
MTDRTDEAINHDDVKITCRACAQKRTVTCEIQDTGLLVVTHDTTSSHVAHKCYKDDDPQSCKCECGFYLSKFLAYPCDVAVDIK